MKRIIGFDLDDTLAITKSPISDRMAEILSRLLDNYDVCVITGGTFQQIKKQVIDRLNVAPELFQKFHAMPTCGTRYYRFDAADNEWKIQYANDLSDEQKTQITAALEEVAKEMGIWCENPAGEIIEDRHSQITMSALGQQATPEDKYVWAEKYKDVRPIYRDKVAEKLPGLEVRIGGTTSTDITLPGIDKAYGIGRLLELNGWSKEESLFFGDKIEEGGNDFPVKQMGVDSIGVRGWEDTAYALEGINAVS